MQNQVLKSIQCATSHNYAKEKDASKTCAQCDIGYTFIAREPMTIKCGHHVCKECEKRTSNWSNCKICGAKVELTGASGIAADALAQVFIHLTCFKFINDEILFQQLNRFS